MYDSRFVCTDAPVGVNKKPSLPRMTGHQMELLLDPLGTAEGC